ncbi:DUF2591 domain-containing protein [Cronobacter sakazakii]|nr:DUF2591 domain-containing protein [Cronobacter sakazakii]
MDYSKLSDQEINGLVIDTLSDGNQAHRNGVGSFIELLHQVNSVEFGEQVERDEVYARFDPCNNPADAWPIIQENRISVYPQADYEGSGWLSSCIDSQLEVEVSDENPLRAAMIVFLMMQESQHA